MSSATIDRPAADENITAPDDARELTTDQPAAPVVVETAQVDPSTLILEINVRTEAHLTPQFLASIKQHGVLTPIRVVREQDGTLRVRAGQRRTLAAIEVGLHTIPAVIIDATDERTRLVEQVVENDQRQELSNADRVAAFEQMSLGLGMSAAQIAKATSSPRPMVKNALAVAGSATAASMVQTSSLDLEHLALIAEFEGDDVAITRLTATAKHSPSQMAHTAQRIRDDRLEAAARDEATQGLTAAGITIVAEPSWDEKKVTKLRALTDPQTPDSGPLTADEHATCPGHAAYLYRDHGQTAVVFVPGYVCTAPRANGHRPLNSTAPIRTTEEEREERRIVRENNAAWRSAETVRREWLTKFAKRRTAPKGAVEYLVRAVTRQTYELNKVAPGNNLAAELLGLAKTNDYYGNAVAGALDAATPARAQHLALIVALASVEAGTDVQTWRRASATDTAYFTALASWGYPLSEVESLLIEK